MSLIPGWASHGRLLLLRELELPWECRAATAPLERLAVPGELLSSGIIPGLQPTLPQFFHPQNGFNSLMGNLGCVTAQHFWDGKPERLSWILGSELCPVPNNPCRD